MFRDCFIKRFWSQQLIFQFGTTVRGEFLTFFFTFQLTLFADTLCAHLFYQCGVGYQNKNMCVQLTQPRLSVLDIIVWKQFCFCKCEHSCRRVCSPSTSWSQFKPLILVSLKICYVPRSAFYYCQIKATYNKRKLIYGGELDK